MRSRCAPEKVIAEPVTLLAPSAIPGLYPQLLGTRRDVTVCERLGNHPFRKHRPYPKVLVSAGSSLARRQPGNDEPPTPLILRRGALSGPGPHHRNPIRVAGQHDRPSRQAGIEGAAGDPGE